ncbi:MAG: hypothetical protein JWL77_5776 [Chthonomonadaceae bacterium]|nr:hypothetical protein [Chthonomonadaceae bacterium]
MKPLLTVSVVGVISLFAGLLSAGSQTPARSAAPPDLARSAYAVLEAHCGSCHGEKAIGGFNFRSRTAMLQKEQIRTDHFERARIYLRAVQEEEGAMPPPSSHDPLTSTEKAALKAWIFAAAPEPPSANAVNAAAPQNEAALLQRIEQDLAHRPADDRPFLRYFTLTSQVGSGATEAEITAYRLGLSRLLNSLSWQPQITPPVAVDRLGSVLRIDLRRYGWSERSWQRLLEAYPYGVLRTSHAAQHIQEMTGCELAYLRADWFVAAAAVPPLYHDLLDLPASTQELEKRLNVALDQDVEQNRAVRAGLQESGVSRNNRVVERHSTSYGAYWRSYDFQSNAGEQNIFTHPLTFTPSGGEIIFNLPNGLQGYLLVDGRGNRIDDAPIAIVSNHDNLTDPVVHNGLTCMSCHTQGMRRFTDALRPTLLSAAGAADYDRNAALALYREPAQMNAFLDADTGRFVKAARETGAVAGSEEPLVALQRRYASSLNLNQAAAELGLTPRELLARIPLAPDLRRGLGILQSEGGTVKRDAWEEIYGTLIEAFGGGSYRRPGASTILESIKAAPNPN